MLVQQSVAILNIYRFQWFKYHCGSYNNLCMTTKELYTLQLPKDLREQIMAKSCEIVDCTACAKQRSYCKLLVRVSKECEEEGEPFSQWGLPGCLYYVITIRTLIRSIIVCRNWIVVECCTYTDEWENAFTCMRWLLKDPALYRNWI